MDDEDDDATPAGDSEESKESTEKKKGARFNVKKVKKTEGVAKEAV